MSKTTFKTHYATRQEFAKRSFIPTLMNNNQVIVESQEQADRLASRLNKSLRTTLTPDAYARIKK